MQNFEYTNYLIIGGIILGAILLLKIFGHKIITVPLLFIIKVVIFLLGFFAMKLKPLITKLIANIVSIATILFYKTRSKALDLNVVKTKQKIEDKNSENNKILSLSKSVLDVLPKDTPEYLEVETLNKYCFDVNTKLKSLDILNVTDKLVDASNISMTVKNNNEAKSYSEGIKYSFNEMELLALLKKYSRAKVQLKEDLLKINLGGIKDIDNDSWEYLDKENKIIFKLSLNEENKSLKIKAIYESILLDNDIEERNLSPLGNLFFFDEGKLAICIDKSFEDYTSYDLKEFFVATKQLIFKRELNEDYLNWQTIEDNYILSFENAKSLMENKNLLPELSSKIIIKDEVKDEEKNYDGKSRWASLEDLHNAKMLERRGFLIGKMGYGSYIYSGDFNMNILTIASTRSGKGVGVVIPNLLRHKGSVVVLDPKGENFFVTGSRRLSQGDKVYYLDPWNVAESYTQKRINFSRLNKKELNLSYIKEDISKLLQNSFYYPSKYKESLSRFLQGIIVSSVLSEKGNIRYASYLLSVSKSKLLELLNDLEDTENLTEGLKRFISDTDNKKYIMYQRLAKAMIMTPGLKAYINPLDVIEENDTDIVSKSNMLASSLILRPVGGDGNSSFFCDAAETLLGGLISYICSVYPKGHQNRNMLYLRELISKDKKSLYELLKATNTKNRLIIELQNWLADAISTNSKSVNSVYQFALNGTAFLNDDSMRRVLSKSNIDIMSIKSVATSLYLILPMDKLNLNESLYNPFIRLLVTMSIMAATKNVPVPTKDFRVLFMLDEIAQLGTLKYLPNLMAICLGMKINVWTIWQNLSQIKTRYKDDYATILGNSNIKQFFGISENETAEYLSDLGGLTTTLEASFNENETKNEGQTDSSGITKTVSTGTATGTSTNTGTTLPGLGLSYNSGTGSNDSKTDNYSDGSNTSVSLQRGTSETKGKSFTKKSVPLITKSSAMNGFGGDRINYILLYQRR